MNENMLVEVEGEATEGRPKTEAAPKPEKSDLNEGPVSPQKDTSQVLDEEDRQLLND